MALHHSLRELVEVRGAGVTADSEEFRGALDDFLTEDEATLGELNLLVDAVRLGALRRLVEVLDHGADPAAAVWDAGRGLARDRGTDDPTRSCWALAALGYALGKVEESVVHTHRSNAGTVGAPVPPAPPPAPDPTPEPAREPGPDPDPAGPSVPVRGAEPPFPVADEGAAPATVGGGTLPETGSVRATPAPPPPDPDPYAGTAPPAAPTPYPGPSGPYAPVPPVIHQERSGGSTWLVVLLALVVVAGVVAGGFYLLQSGEEDPTGSPGPGGSSDVGSRGTRAAAPTVPEAEALVPYEVGEEVDVYRVDTDSGTSAPLTSNGDSKLPAISPDRETAVVLTGSPFTAMVVDLDTRQLSRLFPGDGPCAYSLRPGWSPDGDRLAVVCTGPDGVPDGIFLARGDGSDPELLFSDTELRGAPTWFSETSFVFGREDADTGATTLLTYDVEAGGEPVPLPTDPGVQVSHADVARDGTRLLFLVSPLDGEEEGAVWTMSPDGSNQQELTPGASYAHPAFSPDGTSVIVVAEDPEDGTEKLAIFPVDAPDQVRYVDGPEGAVVGIPAWGSR